MTAEIEAEYMWGLLHPSLFSGEGGYYLTTLSSAVHVLKNFKKGCEENKNHVENDVSIDCLLLWLEYTELYFYSRC